MATFKCKKCPMVFTSEVRRDRHERVHKPKRKSGSDSYWTDHVGGGL